MKQAITEVNGISITKNLIGINYTKGIFIKPKYILFFINFLNKTGDHNNPFLVLIPLSFK